jgi:deoxyribodipyrimidine photo-lyase
MSNPTHLFWFRRDLRTADNRGLRRARDSAGTLYTLFIVDPTHDEWRHACGDRLQFKLDAVTSLRETIRSGGGELLVRTGHAREVLPELARELSADVVSWNRAYEPYELDRDGAARYALEETGVQVETTKDQVLFEEDEILTNDGDPYQVYTYYARKWKERTKDEVVSDVTAFDEPGGTEPGVIPSAEDLGLTCHLEELDWLPTRDAARTRMDDFLDGPISTYEPDRDLPAKNRTSKLSPYLRFGLLSARELYWNANDWRRNRRETDGADTFIEELIWRDFYHQVLYNNPHVVSNNFDRSYNGVPWETHPEWLDAWKKGQTGIPIVDAGMRQLNQTGWMHNRVRMIVAMFLTKQCMIHWKEGETYFMNRLLDGDTAANNGGWQWSASTGTDAAPYFRVFNPISQSEKYDPDGAYIRRYCPELSELPDDAIHAPFDADASVRSKAGITLGQTYPEPILDHKERREHAIEQFRSARQE